ncbi:MULTISPECIES: LysR family transcriptional regulator [Serratia]|uniref:LysR family transcriptional regulator n=1 Tax=Serratia TaxID=613 RepID=UPI003869FFAB
MGRQTPPWGRRCVSAAIRGAARAKPAVSVHLAKLRAIFDDPLLPGPRGMRPTVRAEQLREPLSQALAALNGLRQRTLFSERYVLAGRVGHPKLHENLTLAQFCELEQVMVSPDGDGFCGITDQALPNVGLTRRVVLSVPHFLFVISVLTQSDLVAMLPEQLARNHPLLQQLKPPLAVPGFEMTMLWHKRSHRDPAHQWLREHIVRLV